MKVKSFGTSVEEETIQDKIKSREIVQSILQYGVNQKQIEQIIYLFAMELENVKLMKSLTKTLNESREGAKSNIITGE
jgi:long-subunit acyl-CoA synthetase (AMP-forming)